MVIITLGYSPTKFDPDALLFRSDENKLYANTGTFLVPVFAEIGGGVSPHTHPASDIVSGVLAVGRIPSLNASIINAGTFDSARIPNLAASKITSGRFGDARMATSNFAESGALNPVKTTAAARMFGLAHTYTPVDSGTVLVIVTGDYTASTTPTNLNLQYGTGTPPANNDTSAGTTAQTKSLASVLNDFFDFTFMKVITGLTLSTAYWFDIRGDTTSAWDIGNVNIIVIELR